MADIRPLGEVLGALESAGFESSYAYDDLVFIEHSPFLLRFDSEDARKLYFYANTDLDENEKPRMVSLVGKALSEISISLVEQGAFCIKESESQDDSIDIEFFDKADDL